MLALLTVKMRDASSPDDLRNARRLASLSNVEATSDISI